MTKSRITLAAGSILLVWLAVLSFWPYHSPDPAELRKKACYLERIIRAPQGGASALALLDRQNPEWALFTLSFSTYAFTNMAERDPSFRAEAAHYAEMAIRKAFTDTISAFYHTSHAVPHRVDTAGSVLYLGHLNLMLGCHRLLNPNSPYAGLHDTLTRVLHGRFRRAPLHCLESYPGSVWVADNTVALASLALHSRLTGSAYVRYCQQWVAYARQHLTESKSGLLLSSPGTSRQTLEEPRGSGLGWSINFIYHFAPDFAAEQYRLYQQHLSTNLGVLRLYRERMGNYSTALGDIDSGPLLLGHSIPANAFAFGNAVALRDWRNAQRLRRVIAFGSHQMETTDEISYGVRFVDLSVSPLAEALLLHAETMTPWRVLPN